MFDVIFPILFKRLYSLYILRMRLSHISFSLQFPDSKITLSGQFIIMINDYGQMSGSYQNP